MPTRNRNGIRMYDRTKNISLFTNTNKYYDDPIWKKIREDHIKNFPICEICEKHGRTSAGEHVHHIIPWDSGRTEDIKYRLLRDPNNVITLCKKCHYGVHDKINRYRLTGCSELDDEEYNKVHGYS